MKHCHFSIIYNELPFLRQKLPFLYEHFDQIIFYDLNITKEPYTYSDDGSHEYIKEYPDPEGKIILIEKKDLSDIIEYRGGSFVEKRKMFAVGSLLVRDNIDAFWCTDADEFFTEDFIEEVEHAFSNTSCNTVDMDHYVFFYDHRFLFTEINGNDKMSLFPRVARHKPGNLYGHCSLSQQFPPLHKVPDLYYYHFAYTGKKRIELKCDHHKYLNYMSEIYETFNPEKVEGECWGFPNMHPNKEFVPRGVKRYTGDYPAYLNTEKLKKDLGR